MVQKLPFTKNKWVFYSDGHPFPPRSMPQAPSQKCIAFLFIKTVDAKV